MKFYSYIFALTLTLSAFQACKNAPQSLDLQMANNNHKVVLLDSLRAITAITEDTFEHFFERVLPLDMSIQMQKKYPASVPRANIVEDYKIFLANDVANFTEEETTVLVKDLKEVEALCNKINPNIFPNNLQIVKTKGRHYGLGVWYTRGNTIVIPQDALNMKNREVFAQTLLHEISHVLNRLRPEVKLSMYAAMGFKPLQNTNLSVNDSLAQRLVSNPDGLDFAYTVLTTADGKNTLAMPLIYVDEYAYMPQKRGFQNYFKWNYFEIVPKDSLVDVLSIGAKQQSTLNTVNLASLYKDIFNTNYIIHPNEIAGNNFMTLVYAQKKPELITPLTAKGREFLLKINEILKKI